MEYAVMYGLSKILIKIWWVFPFTFVFSLVAAIKEAVKDGPNDLKYAFISAVSLFVLVVVCMPYYNY